MNSISREQIANGVFFSTIKDNRFKTTKLSVTFALPLTKEFASVNALLSGVLTRSTSAYPDFTILSKKLSDLYGATLGGYVRKSGDKQIVVFSISGLDDRYAFEGDNITLDMSKLLCDVIFKPKLNGKAFCEEEILQEKRQLKDLIDSEFNDKRIYSLNKALSIMCKDEPYGLSRLGTKSDLDKVTGEALYSAWVNLLQKATVEIFFTGENGGDVAKNTLKNFFSSYERFPVNTENTIISDVKNVQDEKEVMELSQSKMIMGFRSGIASPYCDTMAMRLAVAILGGTAHSKLFNNVREKLSLCYYCSARFDKTKGIMTIESGVEKDNIEKARNAILKELDDIVKGNITDFEIDSTKLSMCNDFVAVGDNEFGMETWYLSQVLCNEFDSIEDACKKVQSVTKEEIMEMASRLKLDTVYVLESK